MHGELQRRKCTSSSSKSLLCLDEPFVCVTFHVLFHVFPHQNGFCNIFRTMKDDCEVDDRPGLLQLQ